MIVGLILLLLLQRLFHTSGYNVYSTHLHVMRIQELSCGDVYIFGDCVSEQICVNNEIDADDFDVSLLTIDDDIFEYHERNLQRKKCARKSESRRSRPKLRERVASRCRGRQVRPGSRTRHVSGGGNGGQGPAEMPGAG